jgi:sulfur-carrier protein adenylyltransferase/sulfurtransferase
MLTALESEQYSRHLTLSGFGLEKQLRLKAARVLLVGAGGLGCPIGLYLAAAGVGTLGVVDSDQVERSNLQRQIAHSVEAIGQAKVDSLIQRMRSINPLLTYQAHGFAVDEDNVNDLIAQYDLIIDGTDNFATRFLLADACYLQGIPLLQGAVFEYQGQINLFAPGGSETGACYRCIFREPPSRGALAPCAEVGVLGVIPGLIGTMMAIEAVKFITGVGNALPGKMLVYNALEQTLKTIALTRDVDCPLCGDFPTIHTALQIKGLSCAVTLPDDQLISVEQAKQLLAAGAFLLDVREASEFQAGHLPQAAHLPLASIERESTEALLPDDAPVVVYCQKGMRSQVAVQSLNQLGYERVYSVVGGLEVWPGGDYRLAGAI